MEPFQLCSSSSYERLLLTASYSLAFLLGLGLNGVQLWCARCQTRRWSAADVYLTNLSAADLVCVLALAPVIVGSAMGCLWPFGGVACRAVGFLFFVYLHCSMLFLTCVSVHRFLGVCFPIAAVRLRTRRRALFTSATVWILATLGTSPTLFFAHTGVINNRTVCFESNPGEFKLYFHYGVFLDTVGFLVPFLVVITCYCSMMKVLYCRALARSNPRTARRRNKSLHSILVVCLVFVVCFGPYHVARTVYQFVRAYLPADCDVVNTVTISYKVWKTVVSFNCCANPLLYFWSSGRSPKKLWAWLSRRKRVEPSVVGANRSGG